MPICTVQSGEVQERRLSPGARPVCIDSEPLDDGLACFFSQSQWLDVPGLAHKEVAQRLVTLLYDRKQRS